MYLVPISRFYYKMTVHPKTIVILSQENVLCTIIPNVQFVYLAAKVNFAYQRNMLRIYICFMFGCLQNLSKAKSYSKEKDFVTYYT